MILIRFFDSIFNFVPERFVLFSQKTVVRSSGPFEGHVFLEMNFLMLGVTHGFALERVVTLGIAASIEQKNVSTKAFQVPSTSLSMIILSQSVLRIRSLSNT